MTNDLHCQLPPPLKPGDLLKAIAPSGALRELEAFQKGIEIWRSRGYRVELQANWDTREGYLAGKDSDRCQQLARAWQDPECKGILCIRGGYGSARLLENWSWLSAEELQVDSSSEPSNLQPPNLQTFKPSNLQTFNLQTCQPANLPTCQPSTLKWLIGFSDITNLLWSLAGLGISGIHGPGTDNFSSRAGMVDRSLVRLRGKTPLTPLKGVGWGGGKVSGILLPANLTVATHLLGTPIQPSMQGVILALEDVTEAPYRIDRMLTQWRMSGAFKGVRGIALGRFSRCEPPLNIPSWTVEEVLRDRLSDLSIPIVSNLPFGHDGVNAALPVGQPIQLDADEGILSWGLG